MEPCIRCGDPQDDGWDGLCHMCWEAECSTSWWESYGGVRFGLLPSPRVIQQRRNSRMNAAGRMELAPITRQWIADFLHAAGVQYGCSTFIDDVTITRGYGRLDEHGSFEYPLVMEAR